MSKFKKGDKVRCIDDRYLISSTHQVKHGAIYTVRGAVRDWVNLVEDDGAVSWSADRFELVEPAKFALMCQGCGAGPGMTVYTNSQGVDLCATCAALPSTKPIPEKPNPALVPSAAILAVAELMTVARAKYPEPKWPTISSDDHVAAALRHLLTYTSGTKVDPEFGKSHLVHACARMLMAVAQVKTLDTPPQTKE